MLLHPRANPADQEQNHGILISVPWPLSAKQAANITFSSVKHRTLQSIKKAYRTSGILPRGYRRKDLLTHFFSLRTLIFLRNYLRGSKQTPKENTRRINILQVTWCRFPVLLTKSPNLSRTSMTKPFVYYICIHKIANTFILIEIFCQERSVNCT